MPRRVTSCARTRERGWIAPVVRNHSDRNIRSSFAEERANDASSATVRPQSSAIIVYTICVRLARGLHRAPRPRAYDERSPMRGTREGSVGASCGSVPLLLVFLFSLFFFVTGDSRTSMVTMTAAVVVFLSRKEREGLRAQCAADANPRHAPFCSTVTLMSALAFPAEPVPRKFYLHRDIARKD